MINFKFTNKRGIHLIAEIQKGEIEPYIIAFQIMPENVGKSTRHSYYVSTFLSVKEGLLLDGYYTDLTLDEEEVNSVKEFIRAKIGEIKWEALNGQYEKTEFELATVQKHNKLFSSSFDVTFHYTNWRNETSERSAKILGIYLGCNEYHKEEQWILVGVDLEKIQVRHYALKDMKNIKLIEGEQ
jgi:hypothetical protein